MPTLRLDAYSKGYPAITNRIRAAVLQEIGGAVVSSIIDTAVGHPPRTWTFLGLPRGVNYQFSLDEIDGSGTPINNLAHFSVSPGSVDGLLVRNDEQPVVDTTVGFVSGATSFTFDGTGGKPDYLNWEIVPSELNGRGILVRGVDYSWDKTTGTFSLLIAGDIFASGTVYNIHFEPQVSTTGTSYPTLSDFEINLIDSDTTLDDSYFGKKLICEPIGDYIEVTLPHAATIPQGRKLMVEVGGTGVKCVKFIAQDATVINWNNGNLYAITGESFSIYTYLRGSDVEWRVFEEFGNFKRVGDNVSSDETISDTMLLLDGASVDKFKYARLYEQFVENLDITQLVDYDSWATGNNKYYYSRANSSDPSHADEFHVPDRRGVFERNNESGKAGDYAADMVKISSLFVAVNQGNSYTGGGGPGVVGRGANSPNTFNIPVSGSGTGTETQPKNYLINKYVVL